MKALTQLTTTLIGTGWKKLQADATVELAQLQAIATAARDLVLELNEHHTIRDLHIDVVEAIKATNKALDAKLAAALAALEQETK